jgi:hypothetical protein
VSHHPTDAEVRAAVAGAPRGVWLVTGTPVTEQYPCRCKERLYRKCSAVFCPCSGRPDPPNHNCCGWFNTPEVAAREAAAWQEERERRRAAGEGEEAAT